MVFTKNTEMILFKLTFKQTKSFVLFFFLFFCFCFFFVSVIFNSLRLKHNYISKHFLQNIAQTQTQIDNFFNYKKRPSTTNSDTEEAAISAKMLKIDAEYSTNVIGHSSQKTRKTIPH